MSDVKWFKITTNIFDDKKIKAIEKMPDGDTIIVIWFKLLSLAADSNQNGLIMFTEKIPYTDLLLKNYLDRKDTVVNLALTTFKQFDMLEDVNDDMLLISNWEKHQNIAGLDRIREQNKIRQERFRNKKKLELELKIENIEDINVNYNATRNVTINWQLIKETWNNLNLRQIRGLTDKRKKHIRARIRDFSEEKFIALIVAIKDSEFLMKQNGKGWFDFDWILKPDNAMKIYEGKYHETLDVQFRNYGKNILPKDIESDWLDAYIAKL